MHHNNAHQRSSSPAPNRRPNLTLATLATLYLSTALAAHSQIQPQPNPALMKYACGPANRTFATLSPASRFTDTTAGFDLLPSPTVEAKSCTSDKPFFFSVPIPEGSYRVTVVLGGPKASVTTIRAEGRRLMIEKIPTQPGDSTHQNLRYERPLSRNLRRFRQQGPPQAARTRHPRLGPQTHPRVQRRPSQRPLHRHRTNPQRARPLPRRGLHRRRSVLRALGRLGTNAPALLPPRHRHREPRRIW